MTRNPDKLALTRAIERACAELCAIRDGIHPSSIRSIELQADSAQTYASYASEILAVSGALHAEAIEIAAGLTDHKITAADRADFMAFDAEKSALNEIIDAAQRMVEEAEEAA